MNANMYLPSITTRPVKPGDERSVAKGNTGVDDEMLPKMVNEMLNITRYTNGEVNEHDLEQVVANTATLLNNNYKNEAVRKMYTHY